MRLARLPDFLAILEAGSVRAAARKLGVSQPALTKGLRQIETELGLKLFQRTPTGMVPTHFGMILSARARVVRAELRKIEEELSRLNEKRHGLVSVGIGAAVATLVMPSALKQFRVQFPDTRVRVVEGLSHTLLPSVRDETLDLLIGARPSGKLDGAFRFRPLFHSPRAVVARKNHPRANAKSITELADADWAGLAPFGDWSETSVMTTHPLLLNVRQLVECSSYNSVVALLANTDMVAILSRRQLFEPYARAYLQEIKVSEKLPAFSVGLFSRDSCCCRNGEESFSRFAPVE
jgi:DNA-binding transcriptional LysR family regulator